MAQLKIGSIKDNGNFVVEFPLIEGSKMSFSETDIIFTNFIERDTGPLVSINPSGTLSINGEFIEE